MLVFIKTILALLLTVYDVHTALLLWRHLVNRNKIRKCLRAGLPARLAIGKIYSYNSYTERSLYNTELLIGRIFA